MARYATGRSLGVDERRRVVWIVAVAVSTNRDTLVRVAQVWVGQTDRLHLNQARHCRGPSALPHPRHEAGHPGHPAHQRQCPRQGAPLRQQPPFAVSLSMAARQSRASTPATHQRSGPGCGGQQRRGLRSSLGGVVGRSHRQVSHGARSGFRAGVSARRWQARQVWQELPAGARSCARAIQMLSLAHQALVAGDAVSIVDP